jgi:hypothetical protein
MAVEFGPGSYQKHFNLLKYNALKVSFGGETGIRTLGTREGSTVFETAPFDHSGISPRGSRWAAFNRESAA